MNKETHNNNNEAASGASEWDILSQDLQNEIAETVEDVAIEEETKAEEAEKAKQETSELIQEVIKLRGGAESVKQGKWDNDQKAHIDANGMPTDYAHLMRYVQENPDAIETLTAERDSLLSKIEASDEDKDAYARWQDENMVKNAENLFPDDPLAQEIAATNSLLNGESKEDFVNRIRRAAEAQRVAESGPSRMETGESQAAYNKRIAEATDAAMKRENIISDFDHNRPLWPQLDKQQKTEVLHAYPRHDDETSAQWQARVEQELGVPVWENSKTEKGKDQGTPTPTPESSKGPDAPKGPEAPKDSDDSDKPEDNPADKPEDATDGAADAEKDKAKDYFPRPIAFASNEWYYMNRKERREAALKARAEAAAAEAAKVEGKPAEGTAEETKAEGPTEEKVAEAPKAEETKAEEPKAEEAKAETTEKKKVKAELGEKAKELKGKLEGLHSLRWTIMSREASIKSAQFELDQIGKPGIFDSKGRKRRKELLDMIAKDQADIDAARQKYPAAEKAFMEEIKNANLSDDEIAALTKVDNAYASRAGRGGEGTITIAEGVGKLKGLVKHWEQTVEEAKKRNDKLHLAANTEELLRQRKSLVREQALMDQMATEEFKPVMEKIKDQEKKLSPREVYSQAMSKILAFRKEANEKMASLPEDQKEAYQQERNNKFKELATKVGEASRGFCLELANQCASKELGTEWANAIKSADVQSMFYAYRKVAEIVPGIKAESAAAAKRTYDTITNDAHRKFVEDALRKYFGASESFIAQLRGTDGEQQNAAA